METVTPSPAGNEVEFRLLTDWGGMRDPHRSRQAGVLSLLAHLAVVAAVALMPTTVLTPARVERHLLTPLVEPLTELTQKAPNKSKINKEFTAVDTEPKPAIQIPAAPPSLRAARPLVLPSPARPAPGVPLPEPPKLPEMARVIPPRIEEMPPPVPPPQIQTQEKPKLVFENPNPPPPSVPPGTGRVAIPSTSVQDAIRSVARGGSGGGIVIGDLGASSPGGIGEAIRQTPAPGTQASNIELLSDPQGVDFRPYLTRILASVRRNWFAVMPESAKLGRRGRVGIQFAINRDGSVPKLVIVSHSGTDALDRAAVAGISASNPFPPLPTEFKGQQIRIQFNFAYNINR